MQRHHILPRALLSRGSLAPLLDAIGKDRFCFEDFRANGLLLPARDEAVFRTGLPLHRGPHSIYNELVLERFGEIEANWSAGRLKCPDRARETACQQLAALQRVLRAQLLDRRQRMLLSRRDPLGAGVDFTALDAMVEQLWPATAAA